MPNYYIKIEGVEIHKLKTGGYRVATEKLFDGGRNADGDMKARLLGLYPKISLEFVPMPADDIRPILEILKADPLAVVWYDEIIETYRSGDFYTGSYDYGVKNHNTGLYDGFTVNLISYEKMIE